MKQRARTFPCHERALVSTVLLDSRRASAQSDSALRFARESRGPCGGQEINRGEAGISEWLDALRANFKDWRVYISPNLIDTEYAAGHALEKLSGRASCRNGYSSAPRSFHEVIPCRERVRVRESDPRLRARRDKRSPPSHDGGPSTRSGTQVPNERNPGGPSSGP